MKCKIRLVLIITWFEFLPPCLGTFGTLSQSLASLLTGNGVNGRLQQVQPQGQSNGVLMTTQTGSQLNQPGTLTINGVPATFGTNIGTSAVGGSIGTNIGANIRSNNLINANGATAATFNLANRQSMSARILDGLIPGLGGGGGLFGGGGGNGIGGGLPGIPPGMTVTGDGCLCPMPKARTKYIAVEVPQVIFVPPKEKTKIITIKEVVTEKTPSYGDFDAGGGYEEDSGSSEPYPGGGSGMPEGTAGGYGDNDR